MTEPRPPLAGRRGWVGLAVIALPCLLAAVWLRGAAAARHITKDDPEQAPACAG